MYVFIDESGIHKKDGYSSVVFVCVMVENLIALEKAVFEAEMNFGLFHWTHSSWASRQGFIKRVCKEEFFVKIILVQNPFYEGVFYEDIFKNVFTETNMRAVVIDGKKSKSYEQKIKKILRRNGVSTKKLRTGNDENFPILRVADAIAGAMRYIDEKPRDKYASSIYGHFKRKIVMLVR